MKQIVLESQLGIHSQQNFNLKKSLKIDRALTRVVLFKTVSINGLMYILNSDLLLLKVKNLCCLFTEFLTFNAY